MLSGETANTNFIVFNLIWPGLEPTIYCTEGEYANNYTTDAVVYLIESPYLALENQRILCDKEIK
jgi:hypothetical protein